MEDLKSNFEVDSEFDQERVKLLEEDVGKGGGASRNDTGCRVLDQSELVEGLVRGTKDPEMIFRCCLRTLTCSGGSFCPPSKHVKVRR